MRINCPFCGERDLQEFAYHGDVNARRPDVGLDGSSPEQSRERYVEAIYFLENPAGPHVGLWYHRSGCRSWLKVERNTRTHEILSVEFARPEAVR